MKLGIAKRLTMPDRPSMLRGYGARKELSDGIEDPIEVGVMALREDGGETCLIITADSIGIPKAECDKLYPFIEEKFGIPAERVWISGSHTHFAPGFTAYFMGNKGGGIPYGDHPEDDVYRALWRERMLDAAGAALTSMEECTLEHVQVDVPGIMFNRRTIRKSDGKVTESYLYPEDPEKYEFQPCDSTVSAWRFVSANGPKAMLVSSAFHPVTGGDDFYGVSGDYPWFFKQKVEELFGCPACFMLGAAGDAVPMLRGPGDGQKWARPVSSRRLLGETLAMTLRLNERRFRRDSRQDVAMKVVDVPVSLSPELDYDNAEKNYQEAEKNQATDLQFRIESRYLAKTYPGMNFTMPLRFLRLGEKVLTGMPFEVLSAISLRLKEANPEAVLISITGGYNGYMPLELEFPRGGYESSFGATDFAPGTGDKFLEYAIEHSKRM